MLIIVFALLALACVGAKVYKPGADLTDVAVGLIALALALPGLMKLAE